MKYKKVEHKKTHASHAAHPAEKHAVTTAPKSLFGEPMTIALGLVIIVLLAYIGYTSMNKQLPPPNGNNTIITANQTPTKQAKTTIELFVMSKCPYGVQAETAVTKVLDKFGGDVNLSLHFIASETSSGVFSSLHGDTEVAEDLRQVCIMKYYPQSLINYLSCITPSYPNFEQVWQNCSTQNNMDVNLIKTCSAGGEGAGLLRDNIKRSNDLNVQASPTIYLDSKPYTGSASESSLTRGVCAIIPGSDTCKNLPPEVPVYLTIVNDKNCLICDTSSITGVLTSQFEINNLTVRTVDYSSNEGKALVKQFNLTGVPAYIFDSSITRHSSYDSLGRFLVNIGSSYLLSQQAVPPDKLLNVVEANNTFVLFVMSHCPYGANAENNTKVLLDALPGLKFGGLYFIATQNADGNFTSLHGDTEVAEDLRQVCIMKYYPTKIINYTACISANYANSVDIWQNCGSTNGINTSKIQTCSTGDEGKALLKDNIALTNSLGIGSSPTILLNNNTLLNGNYAASPELMRQAVCGYNPTLVGCNTTLSGSGNTAAASGGGCG
jgi:hypothetical protein